MSRAWRFFVTNYRFLGTCSVIACTPMFQQKHYVSVAGVKSKLKVNAHQIDDQPVLDLDFIKLQVKADKELTWQKVTARSTLLVSGSVASLVEVTASRWLECEALYHKYLQTLIDLLTAYVEAIGTPEAEELWDTIMFIRGFLAEVKEERGQLQLLWSNCQGLSEHAGQAAFLTGMQYGGCRLGETIASAQLNMTDLSRTSSRLELQLAAIEAEEIKESVRRHKEMQEKTTEANASPETAEDADS